MPSVRRPRVRVVGLQRDRALGRRPSRTRPVGTHDPERAAARILVRGRAVLRHVGEPLAVGRPRQVVRRADRRQPSYETARRRQHADAAAAERGEERSVR